MDDGSTGRGAHVPMTLQAGHPARACHPLTVTMRTVFAALLTSLTRSPSL
jgi:hypothetical protein